jgi:3-methylfumaryl-CoA hydratase
MGEWDQWIGRTERRDDRVDEGLVARWLATLDRAAPKDGAVPQAFHWCLGVPDAATAQLGGDGHPRRDEGPASFLPPVPLPRRMWASSEIEFLSLIRVGDSVTRQSRVAKVTDKQGGTGRLVFVDVEHETYAGETLAVREVQTIVFRDAAPAGAPAAPPPISDARFDPAGWDAHRSCKPTEPLLFRYSALTFNAHRIHYDAPYARGEEGYWGLVVHGPLTATLLLDLAQRHFGDNALARFAFRGVSPAIVQETLHLVLRGAGEAIELGAYADDGRQVMAASAAM